MTTPATAAKASTAGRSQRSSRRSMTQRLAHRPTMFSGGFLVLPLAHFVLTGQWRWLWWAVFVLALTTVVLAVGRFYGQDDGPNPEDGSPAGRNPSN